MADEIYLSSENLPANESDRAAREALFLGATFDSTSGPGSGRIRNLSRSGALLETEASLAIGNTIVITFRGVERLSAVVRRTTVKGFGIEFEEKIIPSDCHLPVVATKPPVSNDFVLNLREGYKRPIWDNHGASFRRPGTK